MFYSNCLTTSILTIFYRTIIILFLVLYQQHQEICAQSHYLNLFFVRVIKFHL